MHLDGARIWQTTEFYQHSLAEIASLFDSVYVSFYKDLGGIFGAALLGTAEFIEQARIWARRAGGNPITLYPEVIAARAGLLKYLSHMPQFVDYTKQVCAALRSAPLVILPEQPQVAMFHLRFNMNAESLAQKIVSYAERTGIVVLPLPRSGIGQSCICEISIGDRAIAHEPKFWAKHIQACLAEY
jgi:threonine aldolase